jgi:phosphatidylserine/phosphatidylglycerophosphate/cardiolipin synthase-like enzyme
MWKKLFVLLMVVPVLYAGDFSHEASYQVCFTPGGDCTDKIVQTINAAQKTINMQAYSFTSKKIAYALEDAERRGVLVNVIYDAENFNPMGFSYAKLVTTSGAKCSVDSDVSIAHNKVVIIDNQIVITGSFNFTYAAEHNNAENLAAEYLANFWRRYKVSEKCIF